MMSISFVSVVPVSFGSSVISRVSRPQRPICTRFQTAEFRNRVAACAKATTPSNEALSTTAHRYEGVSWSQVEIMCKRLAEAAKTERYDVVLAVTRGGLVPATLLCEAFQLRTVLTATVIFYTDTGEQFFGMTEPRFLSFPSSDALEGRKVLIVDDVWDSGRTANAVKIRVERANPKLVKIAVLHFKRDMNEFPGEEPDFYAATTSNWIVYPWERASPVSPQIGPEISTSSPLSKDTESARSDG